MAVKAPSLDLRKVPTQKRSKQTFEHILTSAGTLLEEVGFDGFTTNLLAERSNLAIRAIYRYFPNKFALILELAKRMQLSWRDALARTAVDMKNTGLPDSWPAFLDSYIATVRATPGGVAILQAMKSYPELRAMDDQMNAVYIQDVTDALIAHSPGLMRDKAEQIATILLSTTVAVIDASLDVRPEIAESQISMLKRMHHALLVDPII